MKIVFHAFGRLINNTYKRFHSETQEFHPREDFQWRNTSQEACFILCRAAHQNQVPCDKSRSVYLLYGNVRPRGYLKKEVVIMLKNLIFFFFCFFCFVCLFVFCLRGGEHASQGNGGSISRYQLSIKGELQRIDSQ